MSTTRSLIPRLAAGFALLAAVDSTLLGAQGTPAAAVAGSATHAVPISRSATDTTAIDSVAGPRLVYAAFHAPAVTGFSAPKFNDTSMGAGKNVAMIGVGAAGLVAGLLIGGNSGTAIAIGGAVIGLYGLYHFLR
jgi:hypothetical protein